jgi:hypothetical protein
LKLASHIIRMSELYDHGDPIRLWVRILELEQRYDDANPDVGMGPFPETLLKRAEDALSIELTKRERQVIIALWEKTYPRS